MKKNGHEENNTINSFVALGVFGQYLHINLHERQVTVVWSAWDDAEHDPMDFETLCFKKDITKYLQKKLSCM